MKRHDHGEKNSAGHKDAGPCHMRYVINDSTRAAIKEGAERTGKIRREGDGEKGWRPGPIRGLVIGDGVSTTPRFARNRGPGVARLFRRAKFGLRGLARRSCANVFLI